MVVCSADPVDRVEELHIAGSLNDDAVQSNPRDCHARDLSDRRDLDAQALRIRDHPEILRQLDCRETSLESCPPPEVGPGFPSLDRNVPNDLRRVGRMWLDEVLRAAPGQAVDKVNADVG